MSKCKDHPDAPHGFDRNASHNADRYVCECESWEPKQEPVAWMFVNEDGECEQNEYGPVFDDPGVTPLYAAPPKRDLTCVCGAVWDGEQMVHAPRKREWVGLTDEEISEIEDEYIVDYRIPAGSAWNFAKDLEAKLKEKNGG